MLTKKEIEELNARSSARFSTKSSIDNSLKVGRQLAFEEGAFLALEKIAEFSGINVKAKPVATAKDYARLEELVWGDR